MVSFRGLFVGCPIQILHSSKAIYTFVIFVCLERNFVIFLFYVILL